MKKISKRIMRLSFLLSILVTIQTRAELKQYGDFTYAIENYAERNEKNKLGACIYYYTATDSNAILEFPDAIEGYPVMEIGSGTVDNTNFFANTKVRDSIIEASIPESVEIIGYTFKNCNSLETVNFEGNNLKKIGPFTFAYCTNLSSINLPEGVKEINGEAFWKCDSLEKFVIPTTLKYFGTTRHPGGFKDHVVSGQALRSVENLSDNEFPINAIWIPGYDWYLDENGRHKATFIPANSTLYAIKRNKKPVSDNDSSDDSDNNEVSQRKKTNTTEPGGYSGLHTIDLPVREGEWELKDGVWKFLRSDGQYANSQWVCIRGDWYIIGKDGYMLTGWQQINGKWYYFNDTGLMLSNTLTPDGYRVNENGEWIQ